MEALGIIGLLVVAIGIIMLIKNIGSMHLGRLKPRGQSLLALALGEP